MSRATKLATFNAKTFFGIPIFLFCFHLPNVISVAALKFFDTSIVPIVLLSAFINLINTNKFCFSIKSYFQGLNCTKCLPFVYIVEVSKVRMLLLRLFSLSRYYKWLMPMSNLIIGSKI